MRKISDRDKDFISPDGVRCKRVISSSVGYVGLHEKEREVFQVDRDYVKLCKPKKIRFRDGHVEKYDENKHR